MKGIEHEIHKMRFLIVVCVPFFLAGCHTIEGAGTDIEHAGKTIEHTAEKGTHYHHHHYCPSRQQKTYSHKVRN